MCRTLSCVISQLTQWWLKQEAPTFISLSSSLISERSKNE
nr:MAG TPA: hypothetical protein [Caudoviricetes sp.]